MHRMGNVLSGKVNVWENECPANVW